MRRSLAVCGLLAGPATICLALTAPGFTSPAAGTRLEGGQTIAVEWISEGPSGAAFDESELLLSLDGGATFPLRVTRQVAPETHRLLWRVPAFPTRHARLALRTGSSGLADSEVFRLMSEEFVIEPAPGAPLEDTFFVGGEWRTRDALERAGNPLDDPGAFNRPPEECMSPGAAKPVLAQPRTDRLLARPARPPMTAPPAKQATPELLASALGLFPQASFPRRE